MSDEVITSAVKTLEEDAIYPYIDIHPTLGVICKTEDCIPESEKSYLISLQKTAEKYKANIEVQRKNTPFDVMEAIQELKTNPIISGIIIISDYGDITRILYNMIPQHLDIDGLSALSIGTTIGSTSPIAYRSAPCTAVACMKIIEEYAKEYGEKLKGQQVSIIGRSLRIGRPLAELLLQKNMTVSVYHSKSSDLYSAFNTPYVVSAVGKPHIWDETFIHATNHPYCIVDCGMSVDESGKLCGDVDKEAVEQNDEKEGRYSFYSTRYITPVIGGVGKMTTTVVFAKLFNNAAEFFRNSSGVYTYPTSSGEING